MNTKTILLAIVFMTSFVSFSDKTFAENTTGTVNYNVWYDQQEQVLVMSCQWTDNQTFIEPEVSWDVNPNTYGNGWKFGKLYGQQGEVTHKIKAKPCTVYYTKLGFKDWSTGNTYAVERTQQTQGNLPPLIRSARFNQIGYAYAILSLEVDGNCNGSNVEISISETGEVPSKVYTDGFYNNQTFNVPLYGLKANTQYEVGIKVSNNIGSNYDVANFLTESNLPPFIEPTMINNITEESFDIRAYIDTKNTLSRWRILIGKNVFFENFTDWVQMNGGEGNIGSTFTGLEPNTVYFCAPQAENSFGRMTGQTRMFKTNGLAGFMKELTFDDLLRVSKTDEGVIISVEQKAEVVIVNINGQIIGTYAVTDKLDINDLPTGVYMAKTIIGGKQLVKKFVI